MRSWLLVALLAAIYAPQILLAENGGRSKININREWKFFLGDDTAAKTIKYNDAAWANVHLPHNFSIPYFQSAHWYTGYGWYRKQFSVVSGWKGKSIFIEFEGAFREAEIYVNGQLAGKHSGGYTGFSLDVSKLVKTGNNVLAVRLNNKWNARLAPRNGDHNFTGGIYRDVYLVVTDPVHVTWYGTYITTPNLSKELGDVNIQTEVKNDGVQSRSYTVKTDIIDPSGKIVSTVSSKEIIAGGSIVNFKQTTMPVQLPKLWHPKHPFLYKAVTTVLDGEASLDKYETTFGFRWTRWTADSGFFLNGEHYYFKGANAHQDHAGWASAVTNTALVRDVQMIKDCGMNFVRGSHYPHDPAYSDACDTLGMLLWQENDFWGSGGDQRETDNWYSGAGAYPMNKDDQPYFDESVRNDLKEMIRIHRNHPSIIVWSLCNEPFFTGYGTLPRIKEFLIELTALVHELEPTRPVAIGGCQRGDIDKLGDIAGYNGDGARLFINPGVANVVSEYGSTIGRRPGKYIPGWGDMEKQRDSLFAWRSGEAIWCAFDYGTRAGDFGLMGMIDYFRLPKDMWYWYRANYNNIPRPANAINGTPYQLKLSADKNKIANTDGTDDVMLVVSVLDKEGRQLSNSPDVKLQIVSGPGEFPTGRSIVFSSASDIYIRDGKAAIEFHSYNGGKTIVKAFAEGLLSDSIIIHTNGAPVYVEGKTPKIADRPYMRYTIAQVQSEKDAVNTAYQKPTRASSELRGKTANNANDRDTASYWQGDITTTEQWWQVDMENLYTVSLVRLLLVDADAGSYTIELSKDGQTWDKLADNSSGGNKRRKLHDINSNSVGRFVRIIFKVLDRPVQLQEVEVFGKAKIN